MNAEINICKGCNCDIDDNGFCSKGCRYGEYCGVWKCNKCKFNCVDVEFCPNCLLDGKEEIISELTAYKNGEQSLDLLCEHYFESDNVEDQNTINYHLRIAEEVIGIGDKYQELKKRAEKEKQEHTCERCEGWSWEECLIISEDGIDKRVCKECGLCDGFTWDEE